MGQRLSYWVFLGAIGFAAFFLLHSSIAFNDGAPIEDSKSTIQARTAELSQKLGFSSDTLNLLITRDQHLNYYRHLKDSLRDDLPSPAELNSRGTNLSGWNAVLGSTLTGQEIFTLHADEIFNKTGRIQFRFSDEGMVRRIRTHPENPNPTFVAGDSLSAIATHIVRDLFGFNLSQYILNYVDVQDSLVVTTSKPKVGPQQLSLEDQDQDGNTVFKFNWKKRKIGVPGPKTLQLELSQLVKEVSSKENTKIQYGAVIERFLALDDGEPRVLDHSFTLNSASFIVSLLSLGILVILVFYQGLLHINRGHVEWKRAIFIMFSVGLVFFGWRALYLYNTIDPFLNGTATMIFLFNQLVTGGACGLYAAFAYIGWEAMSRSREDKHVQLVDAFWRKRFFFRETGDSLVRGYALGGVLLGMFALLIYLLDTVYYQADSQFGFAEASMTPKLLTINLSTWFNSGLVALGHAGIAVGLLMQKLNKQWQVYGFGVPFLGILFGGSAIVVGIQGPAWYNIVVLGMMAPFIIFTLQKSGLLTFATGWWLFVVILMIMPYWGSLSLDVAYVSWVQGFILLIPLVYGFIAYRYADSVTEIGGYIPEYQERMENHLRVEKEIEIARESQFKLMPLQPPAVSRVDVYGFLCPHLKWAGIILIMWLTKTAQLSRMRLP